MISESRGGHDYSKLTSLIERALESLQARDSDISLNAERLQTLLDTTHEIKDQLVLMNGRVRENEKAIVAIRANPGAVTANHCEERRGDLAERVRDLERRVPSIIQNLAMALITGGAMALVYHFLSKLP